MKVFSLSLSFAKGYELKAGGLFQAVSVLVRNISLMFVSLFDLFGEYRYFEKVSSIDNSPFRISSGSLGSGAGLKYFVLFIKGFLIFFLYFLRDSFRFGKEYVLSCFSSEIFRRRTLNSSGEAADDLFAILNFLKI